MAKTQRGSSMNKPTSAAESAEETLDQIEQVVSDELLRDAISQRDPADLVNLILDSYPPERFPELQAFLVPERFVPHGDDPLLSMSECAKRCGCSPQTVKRYVIDGWLRSTKLPNDTTRVRQSDLDRAFAIRNYAAGKGRL